MRDLHVDDLEPVKTINYKPAFVFRFLLLSFMNSGPSRVSSAFICKVGCVFTIKLSKCRQNCSVDVDRLYLKVDGASTGRAFTTVVIVSILPQDDGIQAK